jgi:post-segregation antitoxin (ccd killing protein)
MVTAITVYVVQIQYDPTLDYGCGIDMTTRDTLHIANSREAAEKWMQINAAHIAEEYGQVEPWDLVVVPWILNATWDTDRELFAIERD